MSKSKSYPEILISENWKKYAFKEYTNSELFNSLKKELPKKIKFPPTPVYLKKKVEQKNEFDFYSGFATLIYLALAIGGLAITVSGSPFGIFLILSGGAMFAYGLSQSNSVVVEESWVDMNDSERIAEKKRYDREVEVINNSNKEAAQKIESYNKCILEDISKRKNELIRDLFKKYFYPTLSFETQPKALIEGNAELFFLDQLISSFGENIFFNRKVGKYYPDFIYSNPLKGILIDIEIDEPYSYQDDKPIHYKDSVHDNERNEFFLKNNWFVVRFAEVQVVRNPEKCISYLKRLIYSIENLKVPNFVSEVPEEKKWTYEEALIMSRNKSRERYLKNAENGDGLELN